MAMKIDDVDIHDVYEFIEHGSLENAPEKIKDYVLLMDKVRGMYLRIDRYGNPESILKHLIKFDGLSRYQAKKVYEDTLEYFYCDSTISKKAWANIYADKVDMMINFSMQLVTDISDAQKVVKMIADAAVLRQTHIEDKEELPDQLFQQPVKIYTSDAAALGMPKINRIELKAFIEKLPELTEKEKTRLLQEADIIPFKLFPNEQEDPRKS